METLQQFKLFQLTKDDLKQKLGVDLHNATIKPCIVSSKDLIHAIDLYQNKAISTNQLLDWVNILWFTDLYKYSNKENDSIASVMTYLEELDEPQCNLSDSDLNEMISCLSQNISFEL